jgi:large subunit ribosomal protein L28
VKKMARKDALTGKGPLSGNRRSHALNATKRK